MFVTKTIFLFLIIFIQIFAFGQTVQMSNGIIINPQDAKSQKIMEEVRLPGTEAERIPYYRIKGSPFWKDEWENAELVTVDGKLIRVPVRLNFVTGEVHFLLNNKERVLAETPLRKIVFQDDSTVFVSNVPNLLLNNKALEGFFQVLTTGKFHLLKYVKRTVNSADSLFGTQKRYFFSDEVFYFLQNNNKIDRIKKLNKDNFLKLLPSPGSSVEWAEKNHIDFKKEKDVIRFLNYYNSVAEKRS